MAQNRKLSYYNFIHKFAVGQTLIWNTYTGSVFLMGEHEFQEFASQSGKWFEENQHYFVDSGILVDEIEQEDQINFIRRQRKNAISKTETINFTILPTTACNAQCRYCFEKGNKIITMTNECISKIVLFIKKEADTYQHIHITWFGGEPLLFKNTITKITEELCLKCGNKHISSDMITNGSLFDEETIKIAKKNWNVSSVQITLDGTEKEYEKIKKYTNLPNAYSVVLKNIHCLIENDIIVNIRLNIDKMNWKDIILLIDQLYQMFGNKINVYAYPIFETKFNKNNLILNKEFSIYLGEVFKKLKEKGYRKKICEFKEFVPWHCASTLPHNFVIMPNGKLLKCLSEIGQELFLGDVQQGVIDVLRNEDYSRTEIDDICIRCCYLPICQGGCLASLKCESKVERCCLEKYYLHELIDKFYLEEIEE